MSGKVDIGEFCPSNLTVKKLNVSAIYLLFSDRRKCFGMILIALIGKDQPVILGMGNGDLNGDSES